MATKQQWEDYVKAVQQYLKELKKYVKKLKEGEVSTQDGIETPPKPPPNP